MTNQPDAAVGTASPPPEPTLRELRARLRESEHALEAIRRGDVDALVIRGPQGARIFALPAADEAYRSVVESMSEGAAALSADGTVMYANRALGSLLGVAVPTLVGSAWDRWVAPGGPPFVTAGAPVQFEAKLRPPDRAPMPVVCTVQALPQGSAGAFAVIVGDAGEAQRRATVERRLALVVRATRIVLWVLDSAGTIIAVHGPSPASAPGGELAGRSVFDVFGKRKDLTDRVERLFHGEAFTDTATFGKARWETHFVPERDARGVVVGAIAVSTPVEAGQDRGAGREKQD